MPKYIDANSVRDDFVSAVYANCTCDFNNDRANCIIDAFDDLPTIEAEPVKHGYWATGEIITFGGRTASPLFCSECLKVACGEPWTYCPNCGAKMDGGGK